MTAVLRFKATPTSEILGEVPERTTVRVVRSQWRETTLHQRQHQENKTIQKGHTCPEDVMTFLKYWQRWTTKNEIAELEEGIWFEPIKATLEGSPTESGRRGMRDRQDRGSSVKRGRKTGFTTCIGQGANVVSSVKQKVQQT